MLHKRTKIFILIFLILVLAVLLIPSGTPRIDSPKNGQAPIRKVWVILVQSQHDQLFEQLRKFAAKHIFRIRISQTDPSGKNFLVQMWRNDIEFVGVDSAETELFKYYNIFEERPILFKMGFYNASEEYPVLSRVVDDLMIDLKELVEEIQNITFTVKE